MDEKTLKVFVAPWEEDNSGWVRMTNIYDIYSRGYVKIIENKTKRYIVCVVRTLDDNFMENYNERKHTKKIPKDDPNVIVMNEYYRDLLRISKNDILTCRIEKVSSFCYKLYAFTHHPDNAIVIATWLSIWSVFLGSIGLILSACGLVRCYMNWRPRITSGLHVRSSRRWRDPHMALFKICI